MITEGVFLSKLNKSMTWTYTKPKQRLFFACTVFGHQLLLSFGLFIYLSQRYKRSHFVAPQLIKKLM